MATKTSIDIDSKGAEAKRSLYNEQPTYLTQIKEFFCCYFVAIIYNIFFERTSFRYQGNSSFVNLSTYTSNPQISISLSTTRPTTIQSTLCTQVLYQRSSINLMPLIRRQQLPRSWSNNVLVSKVKSLGFNWLVLAHSTRWPDLCDSSAAQFEKYKHKLQYLYF